MASYHLSNLADSDLAGIADFTIENFGFRQARRYRDALESCFNLLANNPDLGVVAEEYAPGIRYFGVKSHVIFYRYTAHGVLVARVLHESMDFERHEIIP